MERCENCDLPQATQEDFDTIPGGEGGHLCWAEFGTVCEPAPWRERALKAEDRVRGLVQTLADRAAYTRELEVNVKRLADERDDALGEVERLKSAYLMGLATGLAQGEEPDHE